MSGPAWLAAVLIGAIVIVAVVAIVVFAAVELAKSTQNFRGHSKGTYFYTEWRKNMGIRNMWQLQMKSMCFKSENLFSFLEWKCDLWCLLINLNNDFSVIIQRNLKLRKQQADIVNICTQKVIKCFQPVNFFYVFFTL